MTRATPIIIVLFFGCAADDGTVERGRHVDFVIDSGLTPCGDLVSHMDRFVELIAATWEVDLSDHQFTYHWYTETNFNASSGCRMGTQGCALNGVANSYIAPHDHELVHLVTAAAGLPPSFFAEGAAVAFELPAVFIDGAVRLPGDTPIDGDVLLASALPADQYLLAGAFTRFLIDRFGVSSYLDFYSNLKPSDDLDLVAEAHEASFGESFNDTIAHFDADRRGCDYERFRLKLFECTSPKIAWQGDTATLRRELSCAEDDVVGPFFLGAQVSTWASLRIEHSGLYELSAATDGAGVEIFLGSCGGCESIHPLTIYSGGGPQRVILDGGDYYVRLDAAVTAEPAVSLRIRRLGPDEDGTR